MISFRHLVVFFLFLSVAYYLNLINYFSGFIGFDTGKKSVEEAASGSIIKQVTGLIIFALSIVIMMFSKNITLKKVFSYNKAYCILIVFLIASVVWSTEPLITARRLIAFLTVVFTALILAFEFTPLSLMKFLWQTILLIAVIGVVDNLLKGVDFSIGFSDRENSLRGIYQDKNGAGRIYAYALILLFASKSYKTKFGFLASVFLLFCLLLAQSVSAFAMGFGGVTFVFLLNILRAKDKLQSTLQFIVFIVAVIFFVSLFALFFEEILMLFGRDPSLTNRAIIWELLTVNIEDKPLLGYGFGAFWASNFASGFIERWGFIGNAHSGYFEQLLHGGVIGLALLIWTLISVIIATIRIHILGNNLSACYLTLLIISIVFNYTGYMILNHNSFDMFIFSIIVFLVGVAETKTTFTSPRF